MTDTELIERQPPRPLLVPTLEMAKCKLSRVGLMFPKEQDLSYAEWLSIGRQLHDVGDGVSWWIGDWVNYGENHIWGDGYADAMKMFDRAYGTIANAASIARKIEFSRRRENLTFAHHAEVASLEPKKQDKWLRKAEENQWSHTDLRKEIRADGAEWAEPQGKPFGFIFSKWATDGLRWFRREAEKTPVEEWSPERREAVKKDLRPLVEFYERL